MILFRCSSNEAISVSVKPFTHKATELVVLLPQLQDSGLYLPKNIIFFHSVTSFSTFCIQMSLISPNKQQPSSPVAFSLPVYSNFAVQLDRWDFTAAFFHRHLAQLQSKRFRLAGGAATGQVGQAVLGTPQETAGCISGQR